MLGVIIYRVIIGALLTDSSAIERVLLSTVAATLLNSFSIMILGRVSGVEGCVCSTSSSIAGLENSLRN